MRRSVHIAGAFGDCHLLVELAGSTVQLREVLRNQIAVRVVPGPTPDPIACIHRRRHGCRLQAEITAQGVIAGILPGSGHRLRQARQDHRPCPVPCLLRKSASPTSRRPSGSDDRAFRAACALAAPVCGWLSWWHAQETARSIMPSPIVQSPLEISSCHYFAPVASVRRVVRLRKVRGTCGVIINCIATAFESVISHAGKTP
jgi:hypothetical protein